RGQLAVDAAGAGRAVEQARLRARPVESKLGVQAPVALELPHEGEAAFVQHEGAWAGAGAGRAAGQTPQVLALEGAQVQLGRSARTFAGEGEFTVPNARQVSRAGA